MAIEAIYFNWAGWGLVAFGGAVSLYGYFADRARGRRRCPKCFYDLSATPADESGTWRCPECGRVATNEKQLRRARPRRRVIALGILLALLSNALFAVPRIARAGWIGAVPTTLLAPMTPWYGADFAGGWRLAMVVELKRRVADDEVHAVAAYLWGWRSRVSLALMPERGADMRSAIFDTERIAAACGMAGTTRENNIKIQTLVTSLIDPSNWADNGGATSQVFGVGRVMATDTTADNDRDIHELLGAVAAPAGGPEQWRPAGAAMRDITIAQKLRSTMVRLPARPLKLAEIATLLEQESGVRVKVFAEEIERAPVFLITPLDLGAAPLSAPDLLDAAIARLWGGHSSLIGWCIVDGEVHIRPRTHMGDSWRVSVVYDLTEIVEHLKTLARSAHDSNIPEIEFIEMILRLVIESIDSEGWIDNGGDRSLALVLGNRLVIQGPAQVHAAIADLLAKLRAGPPPRMP